MSDDWKQAIEREWQRRAEAQRQATAAGPGLVLEFPLIAQSFDHTEIVAMVDTMLSGRLTMAAIVREFEARFAEAVGAPYAVMVNSGSSANLLAVAVAANPAREPHLRPGDEVLVPAVCWPTSVWPILQHGLRPVFVDTDPRTLNADLASLRARVTPRTRGLMAVHVLGNSAPMDDLLAFAAEHGLVVIEDTCESLGSRAGGRCLGTLGDFGTYSFYYSHHLTTGEGGMVVCRSQADLDLLKCLRAHGWSRELSNRGAVEAASPDIDTRFLFVNLGFNLRATEVQAAMGLRQLQRLPRMNATRVDNWTRLKRALETHPQWRGQLAFPEAAPGTEPAWFGFPCLLDPAAGADHHAYLAYLTSRGVENRPVIGGNFARQPAVRLLGLDAHPADFPGAERVHHHGFFIGLHTEPLGADVVARLADILLGFPFPGGARP